MTRKVFILAMVSIFAVGLVFFACGLCLCACVLSVLVPCMVSLMLFLCLCCGLVPVSSSVQVTCPV